MAFRNSKSNSKLGIDKEQNIIFADQFEEGLKFQTISIKEFF